MESDNNSNLVTTNSSSDECVVLSENSPKKPQTTENDSAKPPTPKPRLSKAELSQRKSERDAKKAEEEALKAERKRLKEELKAKKAEEQQLEKARKAEELQLEKARKAEERARKAEELQLEKARKAEELQLEKARKAEELQLEKARKAEELQLEKARKAEEKARKEAEIASKKAEQMKKSEQKQAAAQKQELANKQMATYMDRFFKPIEKPAQKEGQTSTASINNNVQRCTNDFDQLVSKQDVNFISDLIENIKSMKKIDIETNSRPRLNSDSNSNQFISIITTTTNPYVLKTRYIHFPEKYFNRPPYYGTLKKALSVNINPLEPEAPIDNIDYTVDSEGEWEEPCKDGEELRSDADDLSDSEMMDDESDSDSFIVPHGHLSDDELNEDEQQESKTTKEAREAAKSHVWNKKVARLKQQRELKPLFGCINDPTLDEKEKFELSNYLHQFQKVFVPKEILQRVEQDDKEQEVTDETTSKDEKVKKVLRKKSLNSKKGSTTITTDQQQQLPPSITNNTPTVKRSGSASSIVDGTSPTKRRKMNSNENCSLILM